MRDQHPNAQEREQIQISRYSKAFLESYGKISGLSPETALALISGVEESGRFATLSAAYVGDIQEHFGRSHLGLTVPLSLADLIHQIYQDPRIIVSRIRLGRNGVGINVVNPYEPELPFAHKRIPVKPEEGEIERKIAAYMWIGVNDPGIQIHGQVTSFKTEATEIVRFPVSGTRLTYPLPQKRSFNKPVPVTSGLMLGEPVTPDILEGLVQIAESFPDFSAASVTFSTASATISLPRNDYEDPF